MEKAIFLCLIVMATADTPRNVSASTEFYNTDNVLPDTLPKKNAWTLTPESGEGLSESERILVISLLVVLSLTNVILTICVVITCKKNARERNGTKIKTVNMQPRLLEDLRDGVRLSKSRLNSRYHNTRQFPSNAYELQECPTDGQTTDTAQTFRQKSDQTQTPKHARLSQSGLHKTPHLQRSISMDPRKTSFQPSDSSHSINRQVSFSSLPGNMAAGDTRLDREKSLRQSRKGRHDGPKEPLRRINSGHGVASTKPVNEVQPPNLHRDVHL